MKKKILFIIPLFLITLFSIGQSIEPAPADKAVVYFTRTSSMGFAINFSYFDSTTLIGVFSGANYVRYECEPGRHIFWARSENKDFVEAEVEAGKVYFLEAIPTMGVVKAGVDLVPVDPTDTRMMKKILKLLARRNSESLTADEFQYETERLQDAIARGIEKYTNDKNAGKIYPQLTKEMNFKFAQDGSI